MYDDHYELKRMIMITIQSSLRLALGDAEYNNDNVFGYLPRHPGGMAGEGNDEIGDGDDDIGDVMMQLRE